LEAWKTDLLGCHGKQWPLENKVHDCTKETHDHGSPRRLANSIDPAPGYIIRWLEAKASIVYNHSLGSSYTVVTPLLKDGCCSEEGSFKEEPALGSTGSWLSVGKGLESLLSQSKQETQN
jgi:hypothetical protein